jgi:hypothetical protein
MINLIIQDIIYEQIFSMLINLTYLNIIDYHLSYAILILIDLIKFIDVHQQMYEFI